MSDRGGHPGDNVDKEVATELLSSKNIKVYNGRNNGRYPHSKYLLINGVYQGVSQKPVYTASQNLTRTSLRESNEVMLRIDFSVHPHDGLRCLPQ